MDPDLIKVTELFLIPSSFLVAALGTADTNPHRFGVSAIGLIVSVLWLICSREALREHLATQSSRRSHRTRILACLSLVFVVGWMVSAVVHAMLWSQPLGA